MAQRKLLASPIACHTHNKWNRELLDIGLKHFQWVPNYSHYFNLIDRLWSCSSMHCWLHINLYIPVNSELGLSIYVILVQEQLVTLL